MEIEPGHGQAPVPGAARPPKPAPTGPDAAPGAVPPRPPAPPGPPGPSDTESSPRQDGWPASLLKVLPGLSTLRGQNKELRAELAGQRAVLDETRAHLAAVQEELGDARAELADQRTRLDQLYRVLNQQRTDLTTEREAAHVEAAREYQALRNRISDACSDAARGLGGSRQDRISAHLRLVHAVCRAAFGPVPPLAEDLRQAAAHALRTTTDPLGEGAGALHRQIASLRADVSQLGGVHRWDFELPVGAPYDAERYELWHNSDGSLPLALCVAPAYKVSGRTQHVPALVHTSRS
jgi:hypothetical protein